MLRGRHNKCQGDLYWSSESAKIKQRNTCQRGQNDFMLITWHPSNEIQRHRGLTLCQIHNYSLSSVEERHSTPSIHSNTADSHQTSFMIFLTFRASILPMHCATSADDTSNMGVATSAQPAVSPFRTLRKVTPFTQYACLKRGGLLLFGADAKKPVVGFCSLTRMSKASADWLTTLFSRSRVKWKVLAKKLCTSRPGTCN